MCRHLAYLKRTVALIAVFLNSVLCAQVEITELSANVSPWRLKWEATGHPSVGQGPPWWSDSFISTVPWAESPAPFGWGRLDVQTNLQAKMEGVIPTLYLRREFTVTPEDLQSAGDLVLNVE